MILPSWGAADIPFSRLAAPEYSQNFGPRGSGPGDDLPNVRVVAGAFPERDNPDERVSSMVMQFGQFLDHDISSTSFPEKRCCLNPSRPECFNINVPESDPSFPMRQNTSMSCIDFARSRPACGQPGREQVNTITAYIDCSNIYGSEDDLASDLRSGVGGRLVESNKKAGHLPTKEQLQQTSDHLGRLFMIQFVIIIGKPAKKIQKIPKRHSKLFGWIWWLFFRTKRKWSDLFQNERRKKIGFGYCAKAVSKSSRRADFKIVPDFYIW